jgi:putative transposase
MGRPLRIEYAGAVYHITSRGNERKKIFLVDKDRIKFLGILADYHERYGILVHAYVLMDTHYHLILETPRGNLLKVMHGLNGGYTGYFNRKYARIGHLFQGRYRGILVEKDAYLIPLSRYIHLNPVRAGVVKKPEEYRWTSYAGYLEQRNQQKWVEYSWILNRFGRDRAREKYREYTEAGLKDRAESLLKNLHGQIILGGEGFIRRIKRVVQGKQLGAEIVERKRFMEYPHLEQVLRVVGKVFGVKEEVLRAKGERGNVARKAALYFAQRYTGISNREIGEYFGGIQPSAVSKASARLKEEMRPNKKLPELIRAIDSSFKA